MLDRFLLSFARYHYAFCKTLAENTGSPFWRTAREHAGEDLEIWEGIVLIEEINDPRS